MSEPFQPSGNGPSGPRSGFWRRFAAAFVDGIALGIVNAILMAMMSDNAASGISIAIGLAYFTYFEGTSGQTLGKKALGIRVIDLRAGGSIGFGHAFIR